MWVQGENIGRARSWGTLPGSQHFRGKGACSSSRMRTRKSDKHQLLTQTYTNQTTSWLMHSLSTFGARTSHRQTQTHKTQHGLNLGESTTFPLLIYFVPLHEAHIQMAFCETQIGVPKFSKLGFLRFWGPITLCVNLWLRWSLKQSCSPHQKKFDSMWHVTCTQGSWVDSRLLMVGSQTANLIFLLVITCVLSVQMNHESPF
jgi:hypothetical protein